MYTPIDDKEYYKRFGIEYDIETHKYVVTNETKLNRAYQKVWENRDFEINKFWTRAAYFWGFIVLTFGAYLTRIPNTVSEIQESQRIEIFILLTGLIFSITWFLVIKGSKAWQRNWEAHIDKLEDYVSGPIYKTVYITGRRLYSVSKLNELLAITVIILWIGLITEKAYRVVQTKSFEQEKITIYISLTVALILICTLVFGYASGQYKSEKNRFIDRWERKQS